MRLRRVSFGGCSADNIRTAIRIGAVGDNPERCGYNLSLQSIRCFYHHSYGISHVGDKDRVSENQLKVHGTRQHAATVMPCMREVMTPLNRAVAQSPHTIRLGKTSALCEALDAFVPML
jgi:hypothetical protein